MEVTFTISIGKNTADVFCQHRILPSPLTLTTPHSHRQGEIHLLLQGRADYVVGTESRTMQAGDFVYIPPKTIHSAKSCQSSTQFIAFSLRGGPKQAAFASIPSHLLDGVCLACKDSIASDTLAPFMPYFYILLGSIPHWGLPNIRENKDYVGTILQYLDTNYSQSISLSSLAEYVGISPKQVQRIIQRETGNTFLEELTARRMSAARYLEENTSMTTAQIANYVGYDSYSGYWKARRQYMKKEQE